MRIERIWHMPSQHTFLIKPIANLLQEELKNLTVGVDAFAGFNSVADITNDLNPNSPTGYHMDALDFLKQIQDGLVNYILYDPPYSFRQVKECYQSLGIEKFDPKQTRFDYWSRIRDEYARILKPNGKAICCGWNSMGLGINRGFSMKRILLVPHGGNRNDTIVTVEIKNEA